MAHNQRIPFRTSSSVLGPTSHKVRGFTWITLFYLPALDYQCRFFSDFWSILFWKRKVAATTTTTTTTTQRQQHNDNNKRAEACIHSVLSSGCGWITVSWPLSRHCLFGNLCFLLHRCSSTQPCCLASRTHQLKVKYTPQSKEHFDAIWY